MRSCAEDVSQMTADAFNNWTGGIANIATALGIVVAGIWVFLRFRVTRESFPRASVTHQFAACTTDAESILVRVMVTVTNLGAVPLKIGKMIVRLQQIAPCDATVLNNLRYECKHKEEGDWPIIGEKSVYDAQCEIEPGENELFTFDFAISQTCEIMSVYTHVQNTKSPKKGWSFSTWKTQKELLT